MCVRAHVRTHVSVSVRLNIRTFISLFVRSFLCLCLNCLSPSESGQISIDLSVAMLEQMSQNGSLYIRTNVILYMSVKIFGRQLPQSISVRVPGGS